MMEIFEFIHLIEISRLVEISDAQKISGLWKPMYKPFTFHLSFDCSTLRKKRPQFLLRPMENVCLIRSLTCASLIIMICIKRDNSLYKYFPKFWFMTTHTFAFWFPQYCCFILFFTHEARNQVVTEKFSIYVHVTPQSY